MRPVGGSKPHAVNLRIIAATNRDLDREVADGNFREDLFYRLNVNNLKVPPLRERRTDVLPLTRHFIERHRPGDTADATFTPGGLSGSVRLAGKHPIEKTIQRALALSGSTGITCVDLPPGCFKSAIRPSTAK